MREKIQATFNQLAHVYENSIDKEGLYNTDYERPAMIDELPEQLVGKHILDAGCAAGWYTEQFVEKGAHVVATDLSPKMVEATERRIGEKAQVMCLDLADDLPFDNQSFDFIVSSLTLHYLEDWNQTFSEFKRILRPNGTVLFSVHHPFLDVNMDISYFRIEKIHEKWKKDGKVYDVSFYRRSLESIINQTAKYFTIDKVVGPKPTENFKKQAPEKYDKLMRRPNFLIVKASK